ncbi:MAG: protein kinase [Actinomycetota bacterium]|nr:protein kinase [Actinomycetota bacterium]
MPEPSSNPAQGSSHPGSAAAPAPAPTIGGRYRLVRLIAEGGMAEVWEGLDEVLARPVAVKVLLPHLARDAAFVQRFKREAVSAARLSHPNIVSLFDTCSDGGTEAIVMALVRGSTLRAHLDEAGPMSPGQVIAVGAQVADALGHAHRSGLIHRDVKPGNILLSDDGRVLVADFGIAKAAEASSDLTEVGQVVGTAKYLSPEQVEGKHLDARSDVYSLGIVLYEALCGRVPFDAGNTTATALARLTTTPLTPRQIKPGIPRALEDVVLRAMARDPADRHPSATALREALLAVDPSVHDLRLGDATSAEGADLTREIGRAPAADQHTPPAGVAAFARQERSWIVPAFLIVVIAGTVGLVGALLGRTEVGQELFDAVRSGAAEEAPDTTAPPEETGGTPTVAPPATSFDPPPGGGEENDGGLEALIDGDPATSWESEGYRSRAFGSLKQGVGVVLTLTEPSRIEALEVDSATAGWAASVYVADEVPSDLSGWGEPVARAEGVDGGTTFDVAGAEGRHILLWVTDLGGNRVRDAFRMQVSELRVVG